MRQTFSAPPLLGLTATLAHGQIPEKVEGTYEPYPEAEGAIGQLLSTYCPGLMLEQCPAEEVGELPAAGGAVPPPEEEARPREALRELELSADPAF